MTPNPKSAQMVAFANLADTTSSYDPFDGMALAVSGCRGFGARTCRQALHESNMALKDFKLAAGDGVRIPAESSGHSYQHIKHRKGRRAR